MLQCSICDFKFFRLFKDHNHSTGIVRGLLCARCNIIVGNIENGNHSCDTNILEIFGLFIVEIPCEKYHAYLESPPLERFNWSYRN